MLVGYARTSTADQVAGLEAQKEELIAAGCKRIYAEQVSSGGKRERLEEVLQFLRSGDTLIVAKPDRLARSTSELLSIADQLTKREIGLKILSMSGLESDTTKATSKLMLTILAACGEFEKSLMKERQKEGIRRAVEFKRYKGRQPTARRKQAEVQRLHCDGMKPTAIATELSISRASVYRLLA
jgi:DNA invertase Pin-like site-specific DNA recombinase